MVIERSSIKKHQGEQEYFRTCLYLLTYLLSKEVLTKGEEFFIPCLNFTNCSAEYERFGRILVGVDWLCYVIDNLSKYIRKGQIS